MKKRDIDALTPGQLIWDPAIKGLGCRCTAKGGRMYVLKYRLNGRQRWITIGRHGSPWTPADAAKEAKRLLGLVAQEIDPADERDALKRARTVRQLAEAFLDDYVSVKLKPSTARDYDMLIRQRIIPALGSVRADALTKADLEHLHRKMKDTPRRANMALAVISKMFSWADLPYPGGRIRKYPERARHRYLSEAELAVLGEALARAEAKGAATPWMVAAIRLLILTGARLGEILSLQWAHVDLERSALMLPDSKTGQKAVFLNAPAKEVLATIPRLDDNPFVICGHRRGAPLVNIRKPWYRIRADAGLDDVRIHDLRHSFASVAASRGHSLPVIGALLGHSQPATTARYAHLANDPVRQAGEATAAAISAAMSGQGTGEVVDLEKRRQGKGGC